VLMTRNAACFTTCAAARRLLAAPFPGGVVGSVSGSGTAATPRLLARSGEPSGRPGPGSLSMEHLLLEVAAAPLKLIAAKNEKSRSELDRFLTQPVGQGPPPPAPSPPPPPPPCAPPHVSLLAGTGAAFRSSATSRWWEAGAPALVRDRGQELYLLLGVAFLSPRRLAPSAAPAQPSEGDGGSF
jgi:hypothetical protein